GVAFKRVGYGLGPAARRPPRTGSVAQQRGILRLLKGKHRRSVGVVIIVGVAKRSGNVASCPVCISRDPGARGLIAPIPEPEPRSDFDKYRLFGDRQLEPSGAGFQPRERTLRAIISPWVSRSVPDTYAAGYDHKWT